MSLVLKLAKLVFWDFDGVIKESVAVKTHVFIKLFESYGLSLVERVKLHHEANGGMSRFEKIPLYLRWAGVVPNKNLVNKICEHFSQMVLQAVIDAPWVPGVKDYLYNNFHQQVFVMVSATPNDELEYILQALDLLKCFMAAFGAPTTKKNAIKMILRSRGVNPRTCLMIGDAQADLDAAQANEVPFLLRRHTINAGVFSDYTGPWIKDFTEA